MRAFAVLSIVISLLLAIVAISVADPALPVERATPIVQTEIVDRGILVQSFIVATATESPLDLTQTALAIKYADRQTAVALTPVRSPTKRPTRTATALPTTSLNVPETGGDQHP